MTSLEGRQILVVEDSFLLAMELKLIIEEAGAMVIGPFAASREAENCLAKHAPDCAVLDVNLGGGASFDLARMRRARGTPFLFFTGYDQSVMPAEFATVTRLEKPVDSTRLLLAIVTCCRSAPVPG